MRNRIAKFLSTFLSVVLICSVVSTTAFARGIVDTDKTAALTLQLEYSGAKFSIYHVGAINRSGELSLTGDFTDYPVSLEQDQAGWASLAYTLHVYTERDRLNPVANGRINAEGKLTFSGLELGLYLVVGEPFTSGNTTVTPQPFIICLPNLYDEEADWVYEVTANPKYTTDTEHEDEHTVNRKVLKVWEDKGNESYRPASIEVELLRDGVVFDTVVLDAKNNWSHSWTGLSNQYDWAVVEKSVPTGYTMQMSQEGITFVITNTNPNVPQTPDSPADPTLPQTGMLWWPVGIFGILGIGFILIGLVKRRTSHEK